MPVIDDVRRNDLADPDGLALSMSCIAEICSYKPCEEGRHMRHWKPDDLQPQRTLGLCAYSLCLPVLATLLLAAHQQCDCLHYTSNLLLAILAMYVFTTHPLSGILKGSRWASVLPVCFPDGILVNSPRASKCRRYPGVKPRRSTTPEYRVSIASSCWFGQRKTTKRTTRWEKLQMYLA